MLIKMGNKKMKRGNNHGIIVKNYEHINRSFKNWNTPTGRYISSKADYEQALAEEGMITESQARKAGFIDPGTHQGAEYKVTKDTMELLETVRNTKDSKGKVHPGDRAIERLNTNRKAYNERACPSHYQTKGGFKEEGTE